MNNILLGELVDHGRNLLEQDLRVIFLRNRNKFLNLRTGRFVLIPVSNPLGLI